MPDLDYQNRPGFVQGVARLNPHHIPTTQDSRLINTVKNALAATNQTKTLTQPPFKASWQKKEKYFWKTITLLFPQLKDKALALEIRPTAFGSVSSFALPIQTKKHLFLSQYVRLDQSPTAVAETILSALVEYLTFSKNGFWENNWEENEAIVDFLLEHSNLAGLFPNYQATLAGVRQKQNANLVKKSQDYLKKLGASTKEIFALDQNKIRVKDKRPKTRFTKNESLVLALLIRQKNSICTIDQIAEQVWEKQTEERFSPWAIAKLIERLRRKLQAEGLSPALIQACRGQGYLLKD